MTLFLNSSQIIKCAYLFYFPTWQNSKVLSVNNGSYQKPWNDKELWVK